MSRRQILKPVFRTQSGDTIVEVLISIAILGTVLAGAYVTSNRSLLAERTAQEHSQALTLAESQVESLIGATPPIVFTPAQHCFDTNDAPSGSCYFPNNSPSSSQATNSPFPGSAYNYHITICEGHSCSPSIPDPPAIPVGSKMVIFSTYKVLVQWPGLAGDTN
ncbi:MAG: type IV pilus modification PilV family protein, partial [Candidatus Saccharimonadales bacterium]